MNWKDDHVPQEMYDYFLQGKPRIVQQVNTEKGECVLRYGARGDEE